jgi:hypothetical protein
MFQPFMRPPSVADVAHDDQADDQQVYQRLDLHAERSRPRLTDQNLIFGGPAHAAEQPDELAGGDKSVELRRLHRRPAASDRHPVLGIDNLHPVLGRRVVGNLEDE